MFYFSPAFLYYIHIACLPTHQLVICDRRGPRLTSMIDFILNGGSFISPKLIKELAIFNLRQTLVIAV